MTNNKSYQENLNGLSKEKLIDSLIEEKKKNALISFALQATGSGIWEWDTATDMVYMTSECFTILGYSYESGFYKYSWLEGLIHQDDLVIVENAIEEFVAAYPHNKELEFRMKSSSGNYLWIRIVGKVKSGSSDQNPVLAGIIDNISQRKELEIELIDQQHSLEKTVRDRTKDLGKQNLALRERERAFSTLLHNMQGMAYRYHYEQNDDWTLRFISEGCLELTGFSVKEFINDGVRMETHIVHPNYIDSVWENIQGHLRDKTSFKEAYPIKTKDGVDKWVLDRGTGVYGESGDLYLLEGVIVDITEQKTQELRYKLAQETMDNAPVAIMWIKQDGTFRYVNKTASIFFGYSVEELYEMKVMDLDPYVDRELWDKLFEERKISSVKDLETTYMCKNGKELPVLINATNMEYEGEVLNCSFINDLTDIKKARLELQAAYDEIATSEEELRQRTEELNTMNDHLVEQKRQLEDTIVKLRETRDQLVQAEKMASLGVLVAGIAHELNNPINYISTGTDALKLVTEDVLEVVRMYQEIDESNFTEKLHEINRLKEELNFDELLDDLSKMGENIYVGAEQAAEIVRGLKSFSRVDNAEHGKCDVHQIIDNVLLMLYNSYKYNIKLKKDYGDIPQIDGYGTKLSQVFMNLLNNAIQAIDGDGKIVVSTFKRGGNVVVKVKDTGSGISEDLRKRIFEPFFTTKETGQGTGLGLSISLGIIEDHNGKIELDSKDGEGTEFTVVLPISNSKSDK